MAKVSTSLDLITGQFQPPIIVYMIQHKNGIKKCYEKKCCECHPLWIPLGTLPFSAPQQHGIPGHTEFCPWLLRLILPPWMNDQFGTMYSCSFTLHPVCTAPQGPPPKRKEDRIQRALLMPKPIHPMPPNPAQPPVTGL